MFQVGSKLGKGWEVARRWFSYAEVGTTTESTMLLPFEGRGLKFAFEGRILELDIGLWE